MAEDNKTLKVRMLRTSGKNESTQWFEYRPSLLSEISRVEWELDTMEAEFDSPVADYLLRAGYAAPIPQGSPLVATEQQEEAVEEPVEQSPPWKPKEEPAADPPPTPSWLKPNGG